MADKQSSQNDSCEDEVGSKSKRRDREASEERLLEAGKEIFAKYGFSGATTKKIALKAKVNEALIGRYFDGKEGLLLSIIERFIADLTSSPLNYEPQDSLESELTQFILAKTCQMTVNQDLAKIIISQALTDDRFRKKSLARVPMFRDQRIIDRLKALQSKGAFSKDANCEFIVDSITVYLNGIFLFNFTMRGVSLKEIQSDAVNFIKIMCKGIG